ncbi:hypothetical protein TIFTF001_009034 [Ficus carica]|uniref:Uncharacterized protein n=1 Tax=Ficus carica TaxID=3494 RepID=A0AA88D107_FICCA|nr:hypothetical protein TIFTF001_009034 [Ficus carica]
MAEPKTHTVLRGSKQALISVADKKNLYFLGDGLQKLGYSITATEGNASLLKNSGVHVSHVVEVPDNKLPPREEQVLCSENTTTWMDPIVRYLTESQLPENREETRRIKNTSERPPTPVVPGLQSQVPRPSTDRKKVPEQDPR